MKLYYPEIIPEIIFTENRPVVLSIENQRLYREFLADLWVQKDGGDGKISIQDDAKEKKLSKDICVITSPLNLDCNDRKIISKVYSQLKEKLLEEHYQEYISVNSHLTSFLDEILQEEIYPFSFELEPNIEDLFKLYHVHLDYESSDLLEQTVNYIALYHQVFRCEYYIIVGLKAFFTNEELERFYEFCSYEKVMVLLVESISRPALSNENNIIIDEDNCVICV